MCVWKKKDCQAIPMSKTADSSSLELSLCSTLDSQWCAYNNSRMSFCFLHVTRFSFYSKTCPSSASFVCENTPFKGSDGGGVPQSAGRQSRVLNQNLPLVYGLLGPSPLSIKQKPGLQSMATKCRLKRLLFLWLIRGLVLTVLKIPTAVPAQGVIADPFVFVSVRTDRLLWMGTGHRKFKIKLISKFFKKYFN